MITLPRDLEQLLRSCPLPWRIETGTRHYKVYVGGRMVTILPRSPRARMMTKRAHLNSMAHIRRAIRRQQGPQP